VRTASDCCRYQLDDQSTPLVTRDKDFRHFARAVGLSLF
jgi:hypothetical protein